MWESSMIALFTRLTLCRMMCVKILIISFNLNWNGLVKVHLQGHVRRMYWPSTCTMYMSAGHALHTWKCRCRVSRGTCANQVKDNIVDTCRLWTKSISILQNHLYILVPVSFNVLFGPFWSQSSVCRPLGDEQFSSFLLWTKVKLCHPHQPWEIHLL
jgi:hypothetical protein